MAQHDIVGNASQPGVNLEPLGFVDGDLSGLVLDRVFVPLRDWYDAYTIARQWGPSAIADFKLLMYRIRTEPGVSMD
jgi:hypothetical protein